MATSLNEYRRVWTKEEDNSIFAMVQKYGVKSWAAIAEKISTVYGIQGRTGKQCRERWHNHLGSQQPSSSSFLFFIFFLHRLSFSYTITSPYLLVLRFFIFF